MIFEPKHIKPILSGRKTTITVTREPRERVGRSYAVQSTRERTTSDGERRRQVVTIPKMRVLIREIVPGEDEWTIRFELDRRHKPRLLARHSERGYTDKPYLALTGEGEAVEEDTQDRFSAEARGRLANQRQDEESRAQIRRLTERIRQLRRAGPTFDLRREIQQIETAVAEAEKRLNRAA